MSTAIRCLSLRPRRQALLWRAVALLFALRALVPAGLMPDFAAARDGRVALAFCTAGALKLAVPAGESGKTPQHLAGGECSFALSAAPVLPAAAAGVPAFAVAIPAGPALGMPVPSAAATLRLPPARAPPLLS